MRLFKRGKTWWIDVNYQGRRFRFSLKTTRKAVALQIMQHIQEQIIRGEFQGSGATAPPLFEDFLEDYLEYAKSNKSPKGFEQDKTAAKHLLKFFQGYRLDQITPEAIEQFKINRLKKVKPISVNRDLQVLRALLNKAIAWGYLRENPMKHVKLFKEPPGRVRYLTQEEINRLLNATSGYLYTIVVIALNTGMRKNEILALRWSQIDFEKRLIFLEKTKNNKRRIIPINNFLYQTLLEWKEQSSGEDRLFHIKDFKRAWKTALKRAGIENFRFHDLRHTFASYLVMNGVDLRTVAELLGHSSLRMVQRYSHLSDEHMRRAVEQLGTNLAHLEESKWVKSR